MSNKVIRLTCQKRATSSRRKYNFTYRDEDNTRMSASLEASSDEEAVREAARLSGGRCLVRVVRAKRH